MHLVAFICYPVGAQIAFFEDVDLDIAIVCDFYRCRVYFARITIQNDVGDRVACEQVMKPFWPMFQAVTKWNIGGCDQKN